METQVEGQKAGQVVQEENRENREARLAQVHNTVTAGKRAKIVSLLGQGLPNTVVATAVGVSESYISQLLSGEDFAAEVTSLRVGALEAPTRRDASYDSLEDKLITKFDQSLVFLTKPMEILSAMQKVNAMTRRGLGVQDRAGNQSSSTVVNIEMPTQIIANFKTNSLGQVIEAEAQHVDGSVEVQSLVTIQSNNVEKLVASHKLEG